MAIEGVTHVIGRRVKQAASYVMAEISPRLTDKKVESRLRACASCDKMKVVGGKRYCDMCGCGHRARAELTTKARMSGAECPLGKWKDVN